MLMQQPIRIFTSIKINLKKCCPKRWARQIKHVTTPPPPHVKKHWRNRLPSWGIATFFHREQTFTGVHKNSV